jgi:hypothetical protein
MTVDKYVGLPPLSSFRLTQAPCSQSLAPLFQQQSFGRTLQLPLSKAEQSNVGCCDGRMLGADDG